MLEKAQWKTFEIPGFLCLMFFNVLKSVKEPYIISQIYQ